MPLHRGAFWFCASFLLGVFLASSEISFGIAGIGAAISVLYSFPKHKLVEFFICIGLVGFGYYQLNDIWFSADINSIGETAITGIVQEVTRYDTYQRVILMRRAPDLGKVQVFAQRYPSIVYGDLIAVQGEVE